jgi:hypothetical protein
VISEVLSISHHAASSGPGLRSQTNGATNVDQNCGMHADNRLRSLWLERASCSWGRCLSPQDISPSQCWNTSSALMRILHMFFNRRVSGKHAQQDHKETIQL